LFFASCKNDKVANEKDNLSVGELAYNKQPTKENAETALSEVSNQIKENRDDPKIVKKLSERALDIARHNNLTNKQISFLLLLSKEYPNDPKAKTRLLELANIMYKINKKQAANVLYSGVLDRFADTDAAEEAKSKRAPEVSNVKQYLTKVGEDVFVDPDKFGINRKAAQSYVDACEAFALAYPNTKEAPEFLYKATEISRTLRTFTKSLSMYDWIIDEYPQYEKAPTAMFLKGFIIENELNNDQAAMKVYKTFLSRYPDHQLRDDVQFLLDNVGKTDEEIMDMIEKNKKPS
jgi:tetratricopeptide (TPR) repeat protein|tara:strand:+ start:894 stop:1769 length:876 start_codon:yes stop_codon:yes gene_type:complete